MKGKFKKPTYRALIGLAVLAVLMTAVNIPPALAQQRTIRIGSEKALRGLTVAEQIARSFKLHEELMTIIPPGVAKVQLRIEINQKDLDDLAVTLPSGTAPLRVGVIKSVPGNVGKAAGQAFNHGVVEHNSDGSFVWAITVASPGAQAIRVHFTDFSLPNNTQMYFIGPNGHAHGPYVAKGRNNNGDFWTRSIVSDTGTLVLNYIGAAPDIDQSKISFTISDIGHIRGRPPRSQEKSDITWPCTDTAPCVVDANCSTGTPADPAKDAVAKMEWVKAPYIYTCSGGLVADTDPYTQIPYFLTANHCLSSSNDSLETFFNYTTEWCDGICPDSIVYPNTIGATVVATGKAGDFTLLTLDQEPPAGAVFLGWNNSPVAYIDGKDLYRISNPNFGPQAYSQHDVDIDSPVCSGWPRGERIYSKDITGATMGGSSGSPVLNSDSDVVGQLSGSCGYNLGDECDSASNWTVDGALAYYWDSVSEFLAPAQSVCTIDSDCDDSLYCNGVEACVEDNCQDGTPIVCQDDGLFCNGSEVCDENLDSCGHTGDPCGPGTICNESLDQCDSLCGNSVCNEGEDCNNCPSDCISGSIGGGTDCGDCFKKVCDGVCHPIKDGPNCPDCAASYCCGDGVCEGNEAGANCEIDCGPPPECGNEICDIGEDFCSCGLDCEHPKPEKGTELTCNDNIDNDCDGFADCEDVDCENNSNCNVACSEIRDKKDCNAVPGCQYDNRSKSCVSK